MKPHVPGECAGFIITATGQHVPQHLSAMNLANVTRLARAQVKRDLRAGTIDLLTAMAQEAVQTMRVTQLLEAQARWGHVRAERACRAVPVSPWRLIGEMTPRQRLALAAAAAGTKARNQFTDQPQEATAA